MNATEAGMVMEVKERLCANVIYPISVREPGSVTSVKVSQYEKAPLPMVVTELGILTEVMPESWKAPWSMMVTESGISIV